MKYFKSKLYVSHNVVYVYDEDKKILNIPIINLTINDFEIDSRFEESSICYHLDKLFPFLYNGLKYYHSDVSFAIEFKSFSTEVNQGPEEEFIDSTTGSEVDW